ncbi:MAG: hypothetical protein EXQ50_02975 [Acidobacteria bacterium]|nr:hypothetical protein [Acidobacteriota bacterium]MSO61045.1 hypothetical protein [Acidobacteriota bacterium]
MSPKEFTFKLTVPRDPRMAALVTEVAGHAVSYAGIEAAAGADFLTRVSAAAAVALKAPGLPALQVIVTGDASSVTFAFDAASVAASRS